MTRWMIALLFCLPLLTTANETTDQGSGADDSTTQSETADGEKRRVGSSSALDDEAECD